MFGVRQVVDGVRVSKGYMYASPKKKKNKNRNCTFYAVKYIFNFVLNLLSQHMMFSVLVDV